NRFWKISHELVIGSNEKVHLPLSSSPTSNRINPESMNNIKVVIFEDNTNLRRGLTTLINGSDGFECAGAFGNCDNLIKNILDTNPDVVLMDIEMPGMDGIEAVKILKPQFPGIKILMETI